MMISSVDPTETTKHIKMQGGARLALEKTMARTQVATRSI